MITLKNLINNSNFEKLSYADDNSVRCKSWSTVYTRNHSYKTEYKNDKIKPVFYNNGVLDSKYSFSGAYSLLLNRGFASINSDSFSMIKGHKYYLMCYTFTPNNSINNKIGFEISSQSNSIIDLDLEFTDKWKRNSIIFEADENSNNTSHVIIYEKESVSDSDKYHIDGIVLIDLTETFGEIGIPSLKWCDNNIEYFEEKYEINEKKNVQILNIKDFVRDEITNIYYNNSKKIKLIFSIEDFDLERNKSIDRKLRTKCVLSESYKEDTHLIEDYEGENRSLTEIYFGDTEFNEHNIIGIQNNNTIFEIYLNCNAKSVGKQFQIIGDNALYGNALTTYTVFNWRSTSEFKTLTYNLDYNLLFYSAYKRLLTGETDPYIYSPNKVNIYVNGTKLAGVKFNRNNYDNCTYEKELFLVDGDNKIVIETVDIFGNIVNSKSEIINVNIIPGVPTQTNLLTNFIGNDDQMIDINMDNVKMTYNDRNAGREKTVNIDMSVIPQFFNLEGINSKYYRISREKMPLVKGDIVQRPVVINFNGIEKIYDGTNDITYQLEQLKFDNGYYFTDISEKYNSYLDTGFVRGSFENLYMQTQIFKKDDVISKEFIIPSDIVDFSSFMINIDGYEGLPLIDGATGNAEIIFDEIEKNNENILSINKNELINLLMNKNHLGLFYCIYEMTTLDEKIVFVGTAIHSYLTANDSIELEQYELSTLDNSNDSKSWLTNELKNWLKGINHSIYGANLIKDEEGNSIIQFLMTSDNPNYIVEDNVAIKYNYRNKLDNSTSYAFKNSDVGKVKVIFDRAYFNEKNVTSNWQPISCTNIKLTGDSLGDESKNYQIANYSAYGRIIKRSIIPHITCLDKIYDGTPFVPFKLDSSIHYNGLENSITGDDVWIDDTYYDNPVDNFHIFKNTGVSYLEFEDSNVGEYKRVKPVKTMVLEGNDATNYYVEKIKCNYIANIIKRRIEIVIDKLRFITSTHQWEVDYHFVNDITSDNLTLAFNGNNEFDFKVYGGTFNPTGEFTISYEIYTLDDFTGIKDIIPMYFSYPFNFNYEFTDKDTQLYYPENTDKQYWLNEARPAEPNTKRIDIDIKSDSSYPGGIKLSESESPYYESQNKDYKLYNNHTVKVTNLNLDPQNHMSDNYELINKDLITTIEII